MCKKTRDSWELLKNEDEVSNYKKYKLKEDNDGRIIISHDNVLRVNAMIQSNSSYRRSADKDERPVIKKQNKNSTISYDWDVQSYRDKQLIENDKKSYKYLGSSAFWFDILKKFNNFTPPINSKFYETYPKKGKLKDINNISLAYVIYKTVCCVDNENSTHLNSDKIGRALLAYRLFNMWGNDLLKIIKEPQSDYKIIKNLSKRIEKNEKQFFKENSSNYYVSFASKWCHNACYYMLDDKYKDNFAKVDSVMKESLLIYKDESRIKNNGLDFNILVDDKNKKANEKIGENYKKYIKIIDAVRKSGKDEISRNGLDQLLWYSNKGFDNDDN